MGTLAGLNPPPVENCRVLELGASEGENLIGMAIRTELARAMEGSGEALDEALNSPGRHEMFVR
jgi:hypothetical protein